MARLLFPPAFRPPRYRFGTQTRPEFWLPLNRSRRRPQSTAAFLRNASTGLLRGICHCRNVLGECSKPFFQKIRLDNRKLPLARLGEAPARPHRFLPERSARGGRREAK